MISLDRSAFVDGFDREALLGLQCALREADRDGECDVVVVDGIDSPFCSADDIADWVNSDSNWQLRVFQETLHVLETIRPVTVARDHGGMGDDGLELALACDLVMAADEAGVGTPSLGWAVAPGKGKSSKLSSLSDNLASLECDLMAALSRPSSHGSIALFQDAGSATAEFGALHAA